MADGGVAAAGGEELPDEAGEGLGVEGGDDALAAASGVGDPMASLPVWVSPR